MGFEDLFVDCPTQPVRKSVFERLAKDSRLQHSEDVKKGVSFASIVGSKVSDSLSFFPLEDKVQSRIHIPMHLAKEAMKTHNATLFGYFLGARIPFPVVQNYIKTAWGKYGLTNSMMNNSGVFFFKFNDVGGCNQVVEQGPLMIRGVPLFVAHWDPTKGLSKPLHTTCPLWIKLHNIPLVAFNKEGISRIASALGVPKQMDACTASMCDKSWGRPSFAKVPVEVWSVGELKKELEVVIPDLNGGDESKVMIRVEYIWEPSQCSHCLVFGHKISSCAKAVASQQKQKKITKVMDEEGFVTVERKQWRPKTVDKPSSSGTKDDGGIVDVSVKDVHNTTVDDALVAADSGSRVEVPSVELENRMEEPVSVEAPVPVEVVSVVPKPTKPDESKSIDRGKGVQNSKQTQTFVKPLDIPVRSILKNPNRFTVLDQEGVTGVEGENEMLVANQREVLLLSFLVVVFQNLVIMVKLTWNIRGLNTSSKQAEVRDLIKEKGVNICALLETHVKGEVLPNVCSRVFGRWNWVSNQTVSQYGTRIIVAWDEAAFDIMLLELDSQFMNCEIKVRGSNSAFFATFIYGANQGSVRHLLWSGVRRFRAIIGDKPWVVAGDFNALSFPHDALGGSSRRNSDMADFASFVDDVEIFDMRYTGVHHTWCQKPNQEAGLRRKLDRVMANTTFTSLFANASVVFLPRGISDHSPSLVTFSCGVKKRKRGFKFDNFLIENPRFFQIVNDGWNTHVDGNFMFRVTSKLKLLKKPLANLRNTYGDLSLRVKKAKHELDVIQLACDLDPFNMVLRDDLLATRMAYNQARLDEEVAAMQRAKVKWLKEGDSNTRYFHMAIKEKRHSQQIHSIRDMSGVYVHDEEVPKAFLDHLKSIIGTSDASIDPQIPDGIITHSLSFEEANHMIRPFTDEDVRNAMFSIGNEKAPGPDGFSAKFFKATWNTIGKDVSIAIHNFFYRSHLVGELNHTLLCLLPKSPNASTVSDFRPIACCKVLYKCISKMLVERIKPALDGLVSRTQSAFIPGRRIVDNILMAHELVVGYQLNVGQPRCAFKIDIRKAYDMVSWDFLFNMLKGFGFHIALIRWLKEMIATPSFSISLNGEVSGFFKGARGIRQGDPLSPYLFTLVMEGFSLLFKRCIAEAADFGYHNGCAELDITHLCFADDLFVFTYGDVNSVEVLKKALFLFAKHSGVPLSPVTLKVADYGILISKVKSRIGNWKAKFLSFGGRKQLVVSVLQSLQLYWMAIFLFPSAVVHSLEALFRDFLWAHGNLSRGKCKVAWDLVCRPLKNGGLGFKRLATWNRALLVKHLWDIATRCDNPPLPTSDLAVADTISDGSATDISDESATEGFQRRISDGQASATDQRRASVSDGSATDTCQRRISDGHVSATDQRRTRVSDGSATNTCQRRISDGHVSATDQRRIHLATEFPSLIRR
ncbi:hypothetical protein OSB04_011729 [Centaurea solstitialis]|uniref:Reverse transcriptase domain-containing protein n=1 Tax=Centaurea solstitialis TaxID=347529 RepID=A0AA38TA03_9ASTR|nr:hypothetical protein OSB04_011729 [Centaurea solstitialis]